MVDNEHSNNNVPYQLTFEFDYGFDMEKTEDFFGNGRSIPHICTPIQ